MKEFTLSRYCYSKVMGTFAELTDGVFHCFAVEQPWADNKPFHSCIPEGEYTVQRAHRPKHGECFEVMDVPGRDSILIHVGNVKDNVEGCIALGNKEGCLGSEWAVMGSGGPVDGAFTRFMRYLQDDSEFKLKVVQWTI